VKQKLKVMLPGLFSV